MGRAVTAVAAEEAAASSVSTHSIASPIANPCPPTRLTFTGMCSGVKQRWWLPSEAGARSGGAPCGSRRFPGRPSDVPAYLPGPVLVTHTIAPIAASLPSFIFPEIGTSMNVEVFAGSLAKSAVARWSRYG